MDLPAFDTRPGNPLHGPLSMWLLGENPFDPDDRPDEFRGLAEALGVTPQKLRSVQFSRSFRDFHSQHTSNLDEIVSRRRAMLDHLYELGQSGSIEAAKAYLTHTKSAESLAAKGRVDPAGIPVGEAASLSDEELMRLSGQGPSNQGD
mgnify:CR=1 FL=1